MEAPVIDTLLELWDAQAGKYFCLATRRDGTWRDRFITRDDWDDLERWVRRHREDDVYFCPHSMQRPSRRELYAVRSHLLWADLDAVDPRKCRVRPSVAWQSSRGRYAAIWKLDREPSRELRRGFNNMLGADAGWHYGKVLRLWGTLNYKYDRDHPQLVKLLWSNGATYRVAALNKYAAPDDGGGSVEAVTLNLDGTAEAVCRKYNWSMSGIRTKVMKGQRSLHIWDLGRLFRRLGATPDEIGIVLWSSRAWRDKYQDMNERAALQALYAEVARVMTKAPTVKRKKHARG
jgi:hypothetical protein